MLAASGVDTGSSVAFSPDQTSGGSVGTYKGRKFMPKEKPSASAARLKIPKNVNLEGLHQAMEEDYTAVDVLKREVSLMLLFSSDYDCQLLRCGARACTIPPCTA